MSPLIDHDFYDHDVKSAEMHVTEYIHISLVANAEFSDYIEFTLWELEEMVAMMKEAKLEELITGEKA